MLLEERVGQPTTEAEAERLALDLYGLHVAAKALPGEYDDNFHLKTRAVPLGASVVTPPPASLNTADFEGEFSATHPAEASPDESLEVGAEVSDEPSDGEHSDSIAPQTPWQAPAGTDFVLKVMHPARESALIDLQCQALQHLAQRAPQVGLPRVCLNKHGEAFTAITSADGSPRLVWLLTYIPGTLMAHANPHSAEMLRSLGELLGDLSTGLAHFSHG